MFKPTKLLTSICSGRRDPWLRRRHSYSCLSGRRHLKSILSVGDEGGYCFLEVCCILACHLRCRGCGAIANGVIENRAVGVQRRLPAQNERTTQNVGQRHWCHRSRHWRESARSEKEMPNHERKVEEKRKKAGAGVGGGGGREENE